MPPVSYAWRGILLRICVQVEKLLSQEGPAKLNSYDMHNLQRRCADLKKHIDSYIKKAEAMKVDVRNAGTADLKEQLLQQLDNLSVIVPVTTFALAQQIILNSATDISYWAFRQGNCEKKRASPLM